MYRCQFVLPYGEGRTCQFLCDSNEKLCVKHQKKTHRSTLDILFEFEISDFKNPQYFFYKLLKHLIRN